MNLSIKREVVEEVLKALSVYKDLPSNCWPGPPTTAHAMLLEEFNQAIAVQPASVQPEFPQCAEDLSPKTLVYTAKQVERMLATTTAAQRRVEELEAELMRMQGRELKLQMALNTPAEPAPVQEPVRETAEKVEQWRLTGEQKWQEGNPQVGVPAHLIERRTLYTTPPAAQRQWVGLTEQEIAIQVSYDCTLEDMVRSVETKLKEKNNG